MAPSNGSTIPNPVTFTIESANVATVQILAEDWPLSAPWDPQTSTQLTYTFTGTGFVRHMKLQGFDSSGTVVAEDLIDITVEDDDPGDLVGQFYNTYYYFAREVDFSGADDTYVYDASCNPISLVPADFSDTVCIQGSGILENGTVISYASTCSCGRPCPTGGTVCYLTLDPAQFPWGQGSTSNAIEPLVSWAVDNSLVSSGTVLYAEEWDGVFIPSVDGIGGFTHDGCFRADDVGGWINGYHYDFFAGTHDMWIALENIFPTHTYFTVYENTPHCAYLN
ncbi:hypothetical protein KJ865_12585 [Myxococcota bacterium]|nr:hypothetical protein [Myxococcota bacterium]